MVSSCQDHSFSATAVFPLALGCHPTRKGVVMALSTQDFCPFIKVEQKKKDKKSTCRPDSSFPFLWALNSVLDKCLAMLFNFQQSWRLLFFRTYKWVLWHLLKSHLASSLGSLLCHWHPPLKGPPLRIPPTVTVSCPGWSATERWPRRDSPAWV